MIYNNMSILLTARHTDIFNSFSIGVKHYIRAVIISQVYQVFEASDLNKISLSLSGNFDIGLS